MPDNEEFYYIGYFHTIDDDDDADRVDDLI